MNDTQTLMLRQARPRRLDRPRQASGQLISAQNAFRLIGINLVLTFLVELALGGRLLIQLGGFKGFLADLVYDAGGFLQVSTAPEAIRSRGIFETETLLAMVVYAAVSVVVSLLVLAALSVSSIKPAFSRSLSRPATSPTQGNEGVPSWLYRPSR